MYTFDDYTLEASATINPELSDRDNLINAALGLGGEVGEVLDHIKKHLYHGHPLDRQKVEKELGDVLWYLNQTAYALYLNLESIAKGNIAKLSKRYPEGFSVERSLNRTEGE